MIRLSSALLRRARLKPFPDVITSPSLESRLSLMEVAGAQMMSLELLPGAKLLQPDETPFAGCSALVVLEEVGTSCLRPPPHVFFAACTRRAHRRRAGTRVV